jgi:hypothetical protein
LRVFFFFFGWYWVSIQDLTLVRQVSNTWATPLALFAINYFSDVGSCFFAWDQPGPVILLPMPSLQLGPQAHATTPGLFVGMGSCSIFFLLRLILNLHSPDLHFPSSWDYRCELWHLASLRILNSYFPVFDYGSYVMVSFNVCSC